MAATAPGKALLSAQGVSKSFGAQQVLQHLSLTIHENDRIGLIGRNGSGKSTLLRILAGLMEPDAGITTRAQGIRVALLEQHCSLSTEQTVGDALETATAGLRALLLQWREAHERLAHTPHGGQAYDALEQECHELEHRIESAQAWHLDTELKKISAELRLPPPRTSLVSLSGGELRRVDLAAKLLSHPDVLLLDEPTNHIDTESVAWIERFLEGYAGACILVTHDRYFLDRVTNRIVEISHGAMLSFPGNYERFLEYKATVEDVQARTESNRLALIKRELAWYRRGPKARGTKAKARITRLMETREKGPPPARKEFAFAIPEPERLGKDILEARLVTHGYGDRLLFRHFSLFMQKGMRVGVMGSNGCGKSTLLRVLMGRESPQSGDILIGPSTHFLYVDQVLADMDPEMRVLDFVSDGQRHVEVGRQRIHVPSYLESFLFDKSCAEMRLDRLSGGERRRVDLAKKLLRGGNFIVFDEPTNDLDLYTLRVLEETVECFDGCALIVSHDRYLLNRLCTHMLIFEESGTIVQITGNYDDYLLYCERRREEEKQSRAQQSRPARPAVPVKRPGLTYHEKQELAGIEQTILDAEEQVARLQEAINGPGFYGRDFTETQAVLQRLKEAEAEVARLYQRWEALETGR
ncbi:MAG: putative ABC transporter ATP-binding protein [Candidatus Hydrogenedentes bacterium ADurb.Bin179]|nr:MAG: putative ABC transporter ATP-binding protein [Candidatus Hydrogenedentes bacterium ADurb.Bin179]